MENIICLPNPAMRLINRKKPAMVVRELSADEAESVRRFCGAGKKTEAHDAAVIEGILAEMRDGREVQHWLECDCRGTEIKGSQQPRLTARAREQGPVHFVRLNGYGPHACALQSFRTDPDMDDEEDEAPEPGKHRPLHPVMDTLDYLDDEHEPRGTSTRSGGRRGAGGAAAGRRLPKLGRILYTMLNDAGINAVTPGTSGRSPDGQSWWDRVNAFAKTEEMSDSLSLSDVLFTEPWTGLAGKMTEIDALPWPAGKKRSALMLFVADEIATGTAIKHTRFNPARVTPKQPLRIGGRDQRHTHPPYWVLAVVDRGRDGTARVREAFAQHAYSKDEPVPLDSHYERRTLVQLLKAIEWVRKKGVAVTLTKPLFDSEVTLETGETAYCRADFELEFHEVTQGAPDARRRRIVIETMGSDSESYLLQKAGMHEIMRRRGALLEHVVRDDDEQDERDDAFCKRVYGRILRLAGVPRQANDVKPPVASDDGLVTGQ
ncbi:hypothetical protein [Burkholderia stagnalis]|uniref:hypothetical protein n=1 Tax=Burkholderia stagnalis TaxID=1503054 RepID=UPI0021AB18D5|nr:hypothetical protein [Burkholderia stagnalis]